MDECNLRLGKSVESMEELMAKVGTFLGIPYDFRWPTWSVIKERMWNPRDPRILTPHVFGWGWSINFYELLRRVGLRRQL